MDRPAAIADLRYLAFDLIELNRLYGAIEAANNRPVAAANTCALHRQCRPLDRRHRYRL